MLLDGLCHNLDGDCEIATLELSYQQDPSTEVDRMERSDTCSVTYEDQKSTIVLVKECEEVDSRFILSDHTISSGNQLEHDHSYQVTELASVTTASSQQGKKMKSSFGECTGENLDGFQSPTKVMDTILSTSLKCPPAPRKPKATLVGKRKGESRNLQVEFVNEVELVLRLLSSEDDKKRKRARSFAAGETNGESIA